MLAALVLAVKFLDDHQQSTKEYAEQWGKGIWSCQQINFTQRCLLENLGYRLLPLWQEDIILEALEDMERAGQQHEPEIYDDDEDEDWEFENENFRSATKLDTLGGGKAVLGLGNQLTPVETPLSENMKGTRDVTKETRTAFKGMQIRNEQRRDSPGEPFPLFMEPSGQAFGY